MIYSGIFLHEHGYYSTHWIDSAIKRQQMWCDSIDQEYRLIKDIPWGMNYPLRHSWCYGTLIKFVALYDFLQSDESHFTWIDLDVYPEDTAMGYCLPDDNLLYAPMVSPDFSEAPGHEHMRAKKIWCGHKADYYALNTGMYKLSYEAAVSLWDFINNRALSPASGPITQTLWWEIYKKKQLDFSTDQPWLYGTEEAITEDWLNEEIQLNESLPEHRHVKFTQLSETIHSVHPENSPLFLHYHGPRKHEYPLQI